MMRLKPLTVSSQSIRYAILNDNVYVGGITIYPVDAQAVTYGILIRKAYRRRGLGKTALRCLFPELKRHGYTHIYARISEDNIASIALHRSLGFTLAGTEPDGTLRFEYTPKAKNISAGVVHPIHKPL